MLHEILWQQNVRLAEVCLHHPFVRGLPLVTSFGPHTLKAFRVWTDEVDAAVLEDLMRRRAARASEQALL